MCINKDKLNGIFKELDAESMVGLLVHPTPDPDCLGAATGLAVLLKEVYGLSSKIFHFGEVSHPQNKSMKNILHINDSLVDGAEFDAKEVSAIVLLDTDLTNSGFDVEKVDLRIDHHNGDRDDPPELSDIRAVGSTCSIVWDYLQAFEISLSDYSDAATAMVLGIKTDTLDFTRASTAELDMEAYRGLLPFVDKSKLAKVTQFPLPKVVFETEAKAFKNKEVLNTALVTFIGEITAHNRDVIPTIADRFVRMDGISTAVILGIINNCIVASVRSDDQRVTVADFCTEVFGKANGGGKEGAGGAKVPLGLAYELLEDKEAKETIMREIVSGLTSKIFEALGEHKEEP